MKKISLLKDRAGLLLEGSLSARVSGVSSSGGVDTALWLHPPSPKRAQLTGPR